MRKWQVVGILIMGLMVCTGHLYGVYDTAKFKVNHAPYSVDRLQNFTLPIPEGEVKELKASASVGTNVDSIVSTKVKSDPNGLIENSVPGTNTVSMTTKDDASVRSYPLTVGGTHKLKLRGSYFVDPDPDNKFDTRIANGVEAFSLAGHKIVSSIRISKTDSVFDKVIANNNGTFVFADVKKEDGKVTEFKIKYTYKINPVSP